jgi:hypothetical protein
LLVNRSRATASDVGGEQRREHGGSGEGASTK